MRLFEIQAEPYPYEITDRSNNRVITIIATFKTRDNSMVKVVISGAKGEDVEIAFTRNGRVKVSGTGDQFRILMTVKEIIEKCLSQVAKDATEILFTADADEPSRVKLYTKRVVPLVSNILGSDWSGPEIHPSDEVVYVWKRKEEQNSETI